MLVGPARTSPGTQVYQHPREASTVDVGSYKQEEKVESKKQKRKKREGGEREERKDREKREKEKERKWGGEEEKWERQAMRLYFYNYCGLARIKGN